MIDNDLSTLLLEEARRINRPEFIPQDPVQFPRKFERLQDIEITSLLIASISWGNRKMIRNNAEKILGLMDYQPYSYVMDMGYEDLNPEKNLHRTFFGRDMQWYLRGLREIYLRFESLDSFSASKGVGEVEAPAWKLAEEMQKIIITANEGKICPQCLPSNLKTTALKRFNMALRWLVRDDGIVDMGVWKSIPKNKLFIPLDVHVGNTARNLGLITRKANDRKSVELITSAAREIIPEDPALLDFALFGISIEAKSKNALEL